MKVAAILDEAKELYLNKIHYDKAAELGLSCATGLVLFPVVLGALQHSWKFIGVNAHLKIAPIYGLCNVLIGSTISASATLHVQKIMNKNAPNPNYMQFTVYTCFGIATFWVMGGRLRNTLPSHLLKPGAFAVRNVVLNKIDSDITKANQKLVQKFGSKYGCHTCGKKYPPLWINIKRLWFNTILRRQATVPVIYISDHQPPRALASEFKSSILGKPTPGALYPQCKSCSYDQSSRVKLHLLDKEKLTNQKSLVTHTTTLRLHKIWLPWPIIFQIGVLNTYLLHFFV